MNVKPLGDRVVIKPQPAEEKTKGGLIIPDTAKERPVVGQIVAAGPGRKGDDGKVIPMEVKVGDKVMYGKYSATEISVDGQDLLVMRENDIIAVV